MSSRASIYSAPEGARARLRQAFSCRPDAEFERCVIGGVPARVEFDDRLSIVYVTVLKHS